MIRQGHILDTHTVALWRCDEASGALVDATGNGNDLPVGGTPSVDSAGIPGLIDGARTPSAQTSWSRTFLRATTSELPVVQCFEGQCTIETWVRVGSSTTTTWPGGSNDVETIINVLRDAVGFPSFLSLFSMSSNSSTHGWAGSTPYNQTLANTVTRPANQWQHVAIRQRGAPGAWYHDLFLDGVSIGTLGPTSSALPTFSTSATITVGAYGPTGNWTNGSVDDTRLSSVARSEAEILESYNRGMFGTENPVSVTYANMLVQLLPRGKVWLLEQGTKIRQTLLAIADELARVDQRCLDFIEETDPRTATETIGNWETMLGLPDDRVTTIPGTLAGRQQAVTQKYVTRGGQSKAFFIALAASCGYTVTVSTYAPTLTVAGVMQAGQPLGSIAAAYSMLITVTATASVALTHAELEAVIRHATHAHITVVFSY